MSIKHNIKNAILALKLAQNTINSANTIDSYGFKNTISTDINKLEKTQTSNKTSAQQTIQVLQNEINNLDFNNLKETVEERSANVQSSSLEVFFNNLKAMIEKMFVVKTLQPDQMWFENIKLTKNIIYLKLESCISALDQNNPREFSVRLKNTLNFITKNLNQNIDNNKAFISKLKNIHSQNEQNEYELASYKLIQQVNKKKK
ncbi:uroporphyrinogen-III C-methyltransferase [Paraphotobacterium marinum]|uniref:uroporphyrinogen-III C-methyltransferase n=1 Tax=Paraphotobacterium marinum TaxID=1755811 RepID=UPI0021F28C70|nr:uroporphyrinogen-III C-methyltransferase [Paraphotobacterium marinum]